MSVDARGGESGFTLIELLVVIAIISLLAAILFPVFAGAKNAAKKTACVSNLAQLSVAETLYLGDSDGLYQSAFPSYVNDSGDPIGAEIQPYVKTDQVMFCPNRVDEDCVTTGNPAGRCYGYAFNWGFYNPWDDGTGLLEPQTRSSGVEGYTLIGKSESSLSDPASTFVFGDTWSTPNYTLAVFDWNGTGSARHAGRFNFSYSDGHVKSLAMRHGLTPAEPQLTGNNPLTHAIGPSDTLSPARSTDLPSYCSDPSSAGCQAVIQWFLGNTAFDSQR